MLIGTSVTRTPALVFAMIVMKLKINFPKTVDIQNIKED